MPAGAYLGRGSVVMSCRLVSRGAGPEINLFVCGVSRFRSYVSVREAQSD